MNVPYLSTTVTNMQPASTLMDPSCVLVLENLELIAKVNNYWKTELWDLNMEKNYCVKTVSLELLKLF